VARMKRSAIRETQETDMSKFQMGDIVFAD
jgi:hypothetical protein